MESRDKVTMCRLCLCENECFINIFVMNDLQGYVAAEVISNLLHCQVSETDGYPHVVCSKCLVKLTDFKLFKESCLKSKVKYDNMLVSSESQEEHPPEMSVTVKAEPIFYSDNEDNIPMATIKSEEVIINSSLDEASEYPFKESETEVSCGPILLKYEVLPFNRDSRPQDVGDGISVSELCQQDPLREASSDISTRTSEHECPYSTSSEGIDADSSTRNISTNDESMFDNTKITSCSVNVEASSSEAMNRSEWVWIAPGGKMCLAPPFQEDTDIRMDKEEMIPGAEGEGGSRTAPEERVEGVRERYECYHCGKMLATKLSLKQHMIVHGFGITHACDTCSKVFKSNYDLTRHVSTHTGYKPYKCVECSKSFSQNSNLEIHMRTHTGFKPYTCEECGKSFSQSAHLKTHMVSHMYSKSYKCEECNEYFSQDAHLKTHMRSHLGSKPFKCTECSKSFCNNNSLKVHMRSHTDSKLYECTVCCKRFSRTDSLKTHMRIHTGYKPYQCKECSKSFSQNAHLERHMSSHTGFKPYTCEECNKSFSQNAHLETHMRLHTSFKPYTCEECSKSFSQNAHLKTHMISHMGSKA